MALHKDAQMAKHLSQWVDVPIMAIFSGQGSSPTPRQHTLVLGNQEPISLHDMLLNTSCWGRGGGNSEGELLSFVLCLNGFPK